MFLCHEYILNFIFEFWINFDTILQKLTYEQNYKGVYKNVTGPM